MNADNATPRPWRAHGCVIESASRCVATTRGGIARADWQDDCPDARLIVRAVNAHGAMREVLRLMDADAISARVRAMSVDPTARCEEYAMLLGEIGTASRAALALADTDRSTTT